MLRTGRRHEAKKELSVIRGGAFEKREGEKKTWSWEERKYTNACVVHSVKAKYQKRDKQKK